MQYLLLRLTIVKSFPSDQRFWRTSLSVSCFGGGKSGGRHCLVLVGDRWGQTLRQAGWPVPHLLDALGLGSSLSFCQTVKLVIQQYTDIKSEFSPLFHLKCVTV